MTERIRTYACVCGFCACELHTEWEIAQPMVCPLGLEAHWTEGYKNGHE